MARGGRRGATGRRLGVVLALVVVQLSVAAVASGVPARSAGGRALLGERQQLSPGQALVRQPYRLVMEPDGDLVEVVTEQRFHYQVWSSQTHLAGSSLEWGPGGDLAVVAPSGAAVWDAGTTGGKVLALGAHGALVVFGAGGSVLWSTRQVVGSFPTPGPGQADLAPGQGLSAGQSLRFSPYSLALSRAGTLEAFEGRRELWSNGVVSPGAFLTLNPEGELVEEDLLGQVVWQTGTRRPGRCLLGGDTLGTPVASIEGSGETWPLWTLTPCWSGTPGAPRVAVVGDSITNLATPQLKRALSPHYRFDISGQPTWTIAQQLPAIRALRDNPQGAPQDFVFNLGTNNVIQASLGPRAARWRWQLAEMLALAGSHCTIVVSINEEADFYGSNHDAVAINRQIATDVAEHPNLHELDWQQLLTDGGSASWLMPDQLHPNHLGRSVLASLILAALQHDCG